ncbi:MAG TPA: ATP synthase F1 subunit epsilon [Candidatus Moranbacteria bacterium]|nr:ATP synthase F1 subunit epsilon [Candidatus Moranbacteria bacterium]HAT75217.1 ATP synthase F1 subunit epsilon [Candidatus Moranbacteria bacterium]
MANNKIQFKIVTPERTVFEDEVDQATLPVSDGEITILPNHRSYIASLKAGEIIIKKDGEEIDLAISGGFIEFHDNTLIILADAAERAEEIDLTEAEEARKRAEDLKNQAISVDDEEYARVAAAIQKESARIKVARKHRTKRGMSMGGE